MELESFTGEHTLSACFFDATNNQHGEECQVMRFTLDGVDYEAIEDPSDGYRSYLDDVRQCEIAPEHKFHPVSVIGVMGEGDDAVIRFMGVDSGKCIMEFGTSNADDYYPGYVAEFHPENIK